MKALFPNAVVWCEDKGIGVRTIIKFGEELGDNIGDAPNIVGTVR